MTKHRLHYLERFYSLSTLCVLFLLVIEFETSAIFISNELIHMILHELPPPHTHTMCITHISRAPNTKSMYFTVLNVRKGFVLFDLP